MITPGALDLDAGSAEEWVPMSEHVSFRPIILSASSGYWITILRARRSGVLSRHHHAGAVHGFVLRGRWHYLEYDWWAQEGSYVFEPPGDIHTLHVPDDCAEMATVFHVSGAYIYLDEAGRTVGYEDVFTKIDDCRRHYASIGLGESYVDRFLR
jgi:quercetin dioxygenase-like cupin family protein